MFDAGIAGYLGASSHRRLQIWFLNECYSQFSYSGEMRPDLFFYESSRGSQVDFVVQARKITYAVKLVENEAPTSYQMRAAEAFFNKNKKITVATLAPSTTALQADKNIFLLPWTSVC